MKQGVGAWFAFRWKGTTLYPRGISRQVLNTSNVKKSKKVPTATNSIVCSNDVAQQGWFSARSRKCSDYKHTEHQCGLMLPSSSTALHPSLSPSISGQSRLPSSRNVGLQILGISCHSPVRTGLLPTGTEHKLGFKVTKPLIAAVTRLLKPVYIILLDKILYVF